MQPDVDRPVVEFRSPARGDYLTLEPATHEPGNAVSVKLRLDVRVHGFSARSESWVEHADAADFALALKKLEATRMGEATLVGEDPEGLELKLSALDRVGHMMLEFKVSCLTVVGDQGRPITLSLAGGFEIDPGLLPSLVAGFDRLISLFTARR